MVDDISVTGKFAGILAGLMEYVEGEHGQEAAHRIFFELYSQTFAHLAQHHGQDALERYWRYLADTQLEDLDGLVAEHGLSGMQRYWGEVAEQEGAGFVTDLTDAQFSITVQHCPPRTWFAEHGFEAFAGYHEHCPALYGRLAARHGYAMEYEPPDDAAGHCCKLTFTAKSAS